MMRPIRSALRLLAVIAVAFVASAHVGSPNVFFTGKAGAYDVTVIVRPPSVIPGMAEVTVRLPAAAGGDVQRVTVRPVFWSTGTGGSPLPDEAQRLAAPAPTFAGKLWLMARGSYSVHVSVEGARGTGTVIVPVAAVATAQRELGTGLTIVLVILGTVLLVGMVTIVRAAASDGLVPPGEQTPAALVRRGRIAAGITVPVLALVVLGGWRWWNAEAADYRRTLYRPLGVAASVQPSGDGKGSTLLLTVTDSAWRAGQVTPVIPDHGKMMHMFIIRDAQDAFAHLHPTMRDRSTFETMLPALPAGTYHVYGDVVHESGFERTLVTSITLRATTGTTSDPDDAFLVGTAPVPVESSGAVAPLEGGSVMRWLADSVPPRVGRETMLRFDVRDSSGKPATLEPYLGMNAHAVVARDDGSVFIHLHPMGTVTAAAQQAFAMRERGDTTRGGRLRLDDSTAMPHATMHPEVSSSFAFPYEFPRAGKYRVWVQMKRNGKVLTAAFEVPVSD